MTKREKPLPPKLAARLFVEDPSRIWVRLSNLLEALDLELADLMPDLQSGRLVGFVYGQTPLREAIRRDEVWFRGDALVAWLATRQ